MPAKGGLNEGVTRSTTPKQWRLRRCSHRAPIWKPKGKSSKKTHFCVAASTGLPACFLAPSSAFPGVLILGVALPPVALAGIDDGLETAGAAPTAGGEMLDEVMDLNE